MKSLELIVSIMSFIVICIVFYFSSKKEKAESVRREKEMENWAPHWEDDEKTERATSHSVSPAVGAGQMDSILRRYDSAYPERRNHAWHVWMDDNCHHQDVDERYLAGKYKIRWEAGGDLL